MRHLDIKTKVKDKISLGDVIATITGNNFGDQIIEYKKYIEIGDYQKFEVFRTFINHEGSHESDNEIIKNARRITKMNELHWGELSDILLNWFGDDDSGDIAKYLAINLLLISKGEISFDEFLESIQ